jgi:acyl-CoA synthetase (AMP-forming)/AMP-acid ligase II
MNTTDILSITNSICPERAAIIFERNRLSFAQLNDRANRLANTLSNMGVTKDSIVAILQVNCSQCVEAYFAAAKLGAIYLPLNFRAKGDEIAFMLNDAEATVLFLGERYIDLMNSISPALKSVNHIVSIEYRHDGMYCYEDLIESSPADEISTEIDDTDTTVLIYTAGTTGTPKGVMLPHSTFSDYVLENVRLADPELEERNILSVPLYHIAGIQAMIAAVYGGRTLVIERQFDPKEWMELVESEKVNRAMMVPTMLKQLIEHPDFNKYDLSTLKVITYGAAPMPPEVIRRALTVFPGVNFINAFGQTESGSTITALNPEDHIISGDESEAEKDKKLKRLSSIGKALPGVEVKVFDSDDKELPPSEVGEIVVKGKNIMTGYWRDEEKTRQTIDEDGWLHTGDVGYSDEDGYFYLSGRTTDMIIRGGENISPEEVEAVLYSYNKIEEVAIIGVPDTEWGEVPRAIVVLKPGEIASAEDIMEYCHERLASFKRPRSVVFVSELPRNPMGKILKKQLREKYGEP